MVDTAPTLFLHGGPGFSAIAERALYGSQLPIHWWDQTRTVVQSANPFTALVEAAEEEVARLRRLTLQPINLVAHSFGAHLAVRLATRVPEQLGHILLLAPVYDIGDAFCRIASRLLNVHQPSQPLLSALENFRAKKDFSCFAELVVHATSVATFFDVYWSPAADKQRRWFLDLLTHQPLIDANVFEVVVRDYWSEPPILVQATVSGSVQMVFGNADPLADVVTQSQVWTARFPHAVTREVDGGHFVHLERPPEVWWTMPAGS